MSEVIIDIGGTKTRVAVTTDRKTFGEPVTFKTPLTAAAGLEKLHETVTKLGVEKPKAIAIGIRGVLDHERTGLIHDDVLEKWVGEPLQELFEKAFNAPVVLENDTAVVGLGEAHFGAGKDAELLVYHTVSTGVGGVKIESGTLDDASLGFEPGHQTLDIDRTVLGNDIDPTLENLISGRAVEERMGMKPEEISQSDAIWDELAQYLAQGLRNSVLYWSPDVIVLGGSMIVGNPRIRLEDIRKHTVNALNELVPCPFITDATLGDLGGLYGAMVLLDQRLD